MLWSPKAKHLLGNFGYKYEQQQYYNISQWQILLQFHVHLHVVLPHGIFRHYSYHDKSLLGYSKKNMQ